MNAPKLRFNDFKSEWEKKPMESLGDFIKGSSLSKSDLSEEGEPCILYGELYTTYGQVIEKVKSKTDKKEKNSVYGEKNDVLIPSSGETSFDIACASALNVSRVRLGGDLNIFRPFNGIDGKFISFQINGIRKNELSKYGQGASVVHLYSNSLKKFVLFIPSLEEQNKISHLLTLMNSKINKQKQKIEKLEEFKKGMMQKVFSQEIRFKDEDGWEFGEWEEKKLNEIVDVIDGDRGKSYPGEHDFADNGYCLFLNTKNVTKNGFNFERESFITKEKHEKMRKGTLTRNDIVMTSRGSIGNIVLYTDAIPYEIVRINSAMLIIRNKDILMDVFFLEQLLKSRVISNFVNTSSVGSAQPHIKVNDLNSLKVTIPSDLREQYKIAGILRIIEKKIEKEKEKLMILENQKKGFMQGMFI